MCSLTASPSDHAVKGFTSPLGWMCRSIAQAEVETAQEGTVAHKLAKRALETLRLSREKVDQVKGWATPPSNRLRVHDVYMLVNRLLAVLCVVTKAETPTDQFGKE